MKEALLYAKFALEEQVRWAEWNLSQGLIDFDGDEKELLLSMGDSTLRDQEQKMSRLKEEGDFDTLLLLNYRHFMNNPELPA